jgi:hypothetical protein
MTMELVMLPPQDEVTRAWALAVSAGGVPHQCGAVRRG